MSKEEKRGSKQPAGLGNGKAKQKNSVLILCEFIPSIFIFGERRGREGGSSFTGHGRSSFLFSLSRTQRPLSSSSRILLFFGSAFSPFLFHVGNGKAFFHCTDKSNTRRSAWKERKTFWREKNAERKKGLLWGRVHRRGEEQEDACTRGAGGGGRGHVTQLQRDVRFIRLSLAPRSVPFFFSLRRLGPSFSLGELSSPPLSKQSGAA